MCALVRHYSASIWMQLNYPNRIWLLRGNHECRQMTSFFNFRDECTHAWIVLSPRRFSSCGLSSCACLASLHLNTAEQVHKFKTLAGEYKYDISVYQAFMESFDTFSLAAIINNRFFAVHGGLSPHLHKVHLLPSPPWAHTRFRRSPTYTQCL